jgi:NAD(P)-dependent dehydrogenase (short-subunit alcohol dehydrogenase family)
MNDRREVERIGQRILLVGGNSAIGEAIARRLASPNRRVLITVGWMLPGLICW